MTTATRTYRIEADPREVDSTLETLATADAVVSSKRYLTGHQLRHQLLNNDTDTMRHISTPAFGVLVARGWLAPSEAYPGHWRISDDGAEEYSRRCLDHIEARADEQADRDHNI